MCYFCETACILECLVCRLEAEVGRRLGSRENDLIMLLGLDWRSVGSDYR